MGGEFRRETEWVNMEKNKRENCTNIPLNNH